jgi:hypothetical protein
MPTPSYLLKFDLSDRRFILFLKFGSEEECVSWERLQGCLPTAEGSDMDVMRSLCFQRPY